MIIGIKNKEQRLKGFYYFYILTGFVIGLIFCDYNLNDFSICLFVSSVNKYKLVVFLCVS